MNEAQRAILLDIFENFEGYELPHEKISVTLDPVSRNVTIVYEDCDDEWFRELAEAAQLSAAPDRPAPRPLD